VSPRTKWFLVVFTLVGALLGAGMTLWMIVPPLLAGAAVSPLIGLIFAGAIALYLLGGVAAIRFARNPAQRGLLRFYYALQVLALASPALELRFFSGAHLLPTLELQAQRFGVGVDFWFGSTWHVRLDGGAAWAVGVNLVAVLVLWLLRTRRASVDAVAVASDVNPYSHPNPNPFDADAAPAMPPRDLRL